MRNKSAEISTNFVGGLNSSVSPLQPVENIFNDCLNVDVSLDGSVSTREPFSHLIYILGDPSDVSGSGDKLSDFICSTSYTVSAVDLFQVEQDNSYLLVFEIRRGSPLSTYFLCACRISGGSFIGGMAVIEHWADIGGKYTGQVNIEKKNAYISFRSIARGYIYLNLDTMEHEIRDIMYIRDFDGVPNFKTVAGSDTYERDRRLGNISFYTYYNLINGGWPARQVECTDDEAGTNTTKQECVRYTRTSVGAFPALTDSFYSGMVEETSNYASLGAYSPWQFEKGKIKSYSTVGAGSVILKLGDETASRAAAIIDKTDKPEDIHDYTDFSNYEPESETTYPYVTYAAEVDGRVFLFVDNRKYNVIYSQINNKSEVSEYNYFEKFYQEADPNDDITNTLVDTDGGTLSIGGLGKVLNVLKVSNSIVIFCDNGIWSLQGDDPSRSFRPSSFSVRKISNQKIANNRAIINTSRGIFFLTGEGLFLYNGEGISNLSENRVDREVEDLISSSGDLTNPVYHEDSGRLFLTYRIGSGLLGETRTLIYNTKLGCFYKWELYDGYLEEDEISSPTKVAKRRNVVGFMAFKNDPKIYVLSGAVQYHLYNGEYEMRSSPSRLAAGESDSGLYIFTQTSRDSSSYYDRSLLHDFGYSSKYDDGAGGSVDGHNSYRSFFSVNKTSNPFYADKIVEDFVLVFDNNPYTIDDPSSGTDSLGIEKFASPKFYLSTIWDWDVSGNSYTEEVKPFIKPPYQENYNKNDVIVYNTSIPGKGKHLSITFDIPYGTHSTGFNVYGFSNLLSMAIK